MSIEIGETALAFFKASNRTVGTFLPIKSPDRSPLPDKPDYAGLLTFGGLRYTEDPTELEGIDLYGKAATLYVSEGVDVDHDFEPLYIVDPDKRKKVSELKKLCANSRARSSRRAIACS